MSDFASRRQTMVDTQVRPSDVTKYPIIDAMLAVPREAFVPPAMREAAYADAHVDLGQGRVLLEPRVIAKMLDALNVQRDEVVLELGCGLGYSTALLARMAAAVVSIEEDEKMAADAQLLLSESDADNAAVLSGPLPSGAAKHGPYDAMIIQGAIEVFPTELAAQLRDGGRVIAIFDNKGMGTCRVGHYLNGNVSWRDEFNASAPLLDGFEQKTTFTL